MEWMACTLGPESYPDTPDSIESLLEQFAVEHEAAVPWQRTAPHNFPEDYLPCRVWLQARFIKKVLKDLPQDE